MTERVGIIDLGSNSARLCIYEIYANNSYRPVFEMKQNVRLAHNMADDGRITREGIARAISCAKLFFHAGTLHGVSRWIPVATAAVRQARNRDQVLDALESEANIRFRVLSGEEEGHYGFLGVVNTVAIKDALLFDIGGASSELTLVRNRRLTHVVSVPFGALNLTEMFREYPDKEAGDLIRDFMSAQFEAVDWIHEADNLPLVGLGGTARALAKLDLWRRQERAIRVHGYPVNREAVIESFQQMRCLPATKRRKIKGLSGNRSEIIVAGLAAVVALLDITGGQHITVSRSGLRDGVFYEHLLQDANFPVVGSVLEHSLTNFQKVFHVDRQVANVVTNAALRLFDALASIHGLDERARQLLYITAQIESCGCYINTEKWTVHSAYLAVGSNLYGPTYPELLEIADLLNGKGDDRLRKLSVLIRLAKALTLQLGIVPDTIECKVNGNDVLVGRANDIREIVKASSEADMADTFQDMFGYRLVYEDFTDIR